MGAVVRLKINKQAYIWYYMAYIYGKSMMIVQRSLPKETDPRERSPQINLARHMLPPL